MKDNLSKDEIIRLLQEEDQIIQEEKREAERKRQESEYLRQQILRKQREAEETAFIANKIEEERNSNLVQRYASEASVHKTRLEQANMQMEELDRRLAELTDSSKNRISKLADQFVELNKAKNQTLTSIELQTRNETEHDLKVLDRSFRNSLERNKDILNKEREKEEVTQTNIDVLTNAIKLSPNLTDNTQDEYSEVELVEFDEV